LQRLKDLKSEYESSVFIFLDHAYNGFFVKAFRPSSSSGRPMSGVARPGSQAGRPGISLILCFTSKVVPQHNQLI